VYRNSNAFELLNPGIIQLLLLFAAAPTAASVEAHAGQSLPPSHLVPLLSNSAASIKKKKKRREHRSALLTTDTLSRGYASSVQPPPASRIVSERSPSAARTRARSVPAKHTDDSYHDEPAPDAFKHPMRRRQHASYGHRSDFMPPKSVSLAIVMWLFSS